MSRMKEGFGVLLTAALSGGAIQGISASDLPTPEQIEPFVKIIGELVIMVFTAIKLWPRKPKEPKEPTGKAG